MIVRFVDIGGIDDYNCYYHRILYANKFEWHHKTAGEHRTDLLCI